MLKLKRYTLVFLIAAAVIFASCSSAPKKKSGKDSGKNSGKDNGKSNELTLNDGSKNGSRDGSGKDGSGKDSSGKDASDYSSLFSKIEKSRKEAISNGAYEELPDFFKELDSEYVEQKKEAQKNGKSDEMTNILESLNSAYQTISKYKEAKDKKKKIDNKGYASNSQKNYDEGASLIEELDEVFDESGSFFKELRAGDEDVAEKLLEKATRADGDFINVFKATAINERSAAFKAKKQADSVKASVSRKSDYDDAVSQFRSGDENYKSGSIEECIDNYISAKNMFSRLYTEVSAARKAALSKINTANDKVKHSWNVADKADKTNPLTEKIEGIEDPDVVLLEADDFTDAENSYVELSEKLEVGGMLL